ncbi:long-chain fatty acid--CoA ligase [Bacillus chungangensis]|uniref:Fatty-acyl-CoA synthase n=1 Tax=Bacillus chungangensis TaxID=587633 RepID=A0ABT9WQR3_9BACI|nr:long-chain fatty acid--CoA ligase [Bacillus chungangensis]MDQ0175292.1 fatty-acyl-CoA synthase [Bacillus chungangensis]
MNKAHFQFWPKRIAKTLTVPETTLYENLAMTTKKYPSKIALYYYGKQYSYEQLFHEVEAFAGYLEHSLGVQKGQKVLLFMQNAPQFIISYFALLRIRAVVVPINPMNTTDELAFYINDCQIKHAIVGQELYDRVAPLRHSTTLEQIIVAAYSDYALVEQEENKLPKEVSSPRHSFPEAILWTDALALGHMPSVYEGHKDDIAVLPYTSGTTGLPKGCVHTNATVQANTVGAYHWMNITSDTVSLATLPLFHVTGMLHSMHTPIYAGGAIVMMTRWNRDDAGRLIESLRCTHWINISTMLIDFLSNPRLETYDISSLQAIAGGGAPLPAAVGEKLYQLTGLHFVEGYGLSESMSHTHFNPPDRPKLQCLGIPAFDVDARIIDPITSEELGAGQEGELIVNGPQLFKGYYNRDDDNRQSFMKLGDRTFFRTGDIAKMDEEGYFFIVDRVKRMINASGYKVWPTEVESHLYKHPAVQQACVVGVPDSRRGETVKAFIILNDPYIGKISETEIIEWSKQQMAAYKYPRIIEFRDTFPTTSSGKILWRKMQAAEREREPETR